MTPDEFAAIARQAWCAETSASPAAWSAANPALGQCVPTSALAQRVFGGGVLWCAPQLPDGKTDSHYFNTGRDYTRAQYTDPATVFHAASEKAQGLGSTYNYMCSFPDPLRRVALLAERFNALGAQLPEHDWLLLDLDDTLIHTQRLYEQARARLARHLAPEDAARQQQITAYAAAASAELYGRARSDSAREGFVYARTRFPASLVTAMAFFTPQARAAEAALAWDIGETAFQQAELCEGAAALIDAAKAGGRRVGIITQGDAGVQRQRLTQLPFMAQVDGVLVTPAKTVETFRTFMQAHGVRAQGSLMVGDSLKSDIIPADAAGLSTVLLAESGNWAAVEMDGQAQPARMRCIARLSELTF